MSQMDADEEEIKRLVLGYSPRFRSMLQLARQQIHEGSGIPHDEFWRDLETQPGDPDATSR
jgi:hypothetical protein